MAALACEPVLHDLPLEVLTNVFHHLGLVDLVRVAQSCTRFGHGGPQTLKRNEAPVVAVLSELAFPRGQLVPHSRPKGCSESLVSHLARCVRQRRFREAPPIAAGYQFRLFVDPSWRLLSCGKDAAMGHGSASNIYPNPTPVVAMARVRMRSVAAGPLHSLVLGWDGRVYSWGSARSNSYGQLGHGDKLCRHLPALVEGLEGVRGIAAAATHSLAVTQSGTVWCWGKSFQPGSPDSLRPIPVEGFGRVRVCRASAGHGVAFAIDENGELFSWGLGVFGRLSHGDTQHQPLPKRVEAVRGIRVTSLAVGDKQALALAEHGLVYACGDIFRGVVMGNNPHDESVLLLTPVEALRGVRVGSFAAAGAWSYAVANTGKLWAWGYDSDEVPLPGHGERAPCPLPKLIASLRAQKVDAVAAGYDHTLALVDDGGVYLWGFEAAPPAAGALGPGPSSEFAVVRTPRRIPAFGMG
jgi:hypothetical protein